MGRVRAPRSATGCRHFGTLAPCRRHQPSIKIQGKGSLTSIEITDLTILASQDPVARLAFAQSPTCTAINQQTLSHDRLDLLVGFASGDIMWIELFSGRYTRYNKDASSNSTSLSLSNKPSPGVVSAAAVKKVVWLQGDSIFATAFQDGCLAFWDKDREDPNSFNPIPGQAPQPGPFKAPLLPLAKIDSHSESNANSQDGHQSLTNGENSITRLRPFLAPVSEYTDDIVITVPQIGNDKKNAGKSNPLAHWKVSRKPISGELCSFLYRLRI